MSWILIVYFITTRGNGYGEMAFPQFPFPTEAACQTIGEMVVKATPDMIYLHPPFRCVVEG